MAGHIPLNKALLDTDIFSEITKGIDQVVAAQARAYCRFYVTCDILEVWAECAKLSDKQRRKPRMTIHLPDEVKRDILAEVQSGHFASVDDAIAEAWKSFRRLHQTPAPSAGMGFIGAYARTLRYSTRLLSTR